MIKLTKKSAPVGRPTAYRPEYCQIAIDMGKQGKSQAQIAARLDIAISNLYEWAKKHSEFQEALTRATTYAQSVWEAKAEHGIELPTALFNAGLWGRIMSARFPEQYRHDDGKKAPLNITNQSVILVPTVIGDSSQWAAHAQAVLEQNRQEQDALKARVGYVDHEK